MLLLRYIKILIAYNINNIKFNINKYKTRSIAQSGSAPGLGPGGREFESLRPDHRDKLCKKMYLMK